MQASLSDYVFRRESNLLLRRMADGRGYLIRAPKGSHWHLFTRRTGFQRPVAELDQAFVEAMRRAQMLVRGPGGGLMAPETGAAQPAAAKPMVQLEPALAEAAERLAGDYERAQLDAKVTAPWDPALLPKGRGRSGSDKEISNSAAAARERVHAALEAVGPELSGLVCEVCCLSAGVEQAERRLGLGARSGRALLQVALTRLARHYGLLETQKPKRRRVSVKQWGLPDYRPPMSSDRN